MQPAKDPGSAERLNDLGNSLADRRKFVEAIEAYQQAISLNPDFAAAHSNLGAALRDLGRIEEAIQSHKRAVQLNSRSPAALNNLGVALTDAGHFADAITVLRAAITYDPKYAEAWSNLAIAHQSNRDASNALAAGRKSIEIDPNLAKARMNFAMILLSTGNLREGFIEHEWRFKCHWHFKRREFDKPHWDGRPIRGGTLLVHAEQGFGDAIHFVRYLPRAQELCQRIILEVHPELARLLSDFGDRVICRGEPLPAFDAHCSTMSLPGVLHLDSYDASNYIRPRDRLASVWREKLKDVKRPRIGICHQGNPGHSNDRHRSMPTEIARKLINRHEVCWINLLKREDCPDKLGNDCTAELHDFADTAALIENLDLVIAVDTAVAHLACAMGKPCWVMLPYVAEWRWMIDRDDSPWYPSARLFRQSKFADWGDVVERVSKALDEFVKRY